jgi:hypothetical protein
MRYPVFIYLIFCVTCSLLAPDIGADDIFFPSRVDNGSFEEWSGGSLLDWQGEGWIDADPADPLLGDYAVQLSNVMPWDGYLYQEFPYRSGPLRFGFACWSWWTAGDKIIVRFFDAQMEEISYRRWDSYGGDWQITFEVLRPPAGTATIRVELVPMLDGEGILIVDHLFMIPVK